MRAVLILALAILGVTGCTAAQTTYRLVDAEVAVKRALDEGADSVAIYEYTMALRYLEKAREENGYAEYGQAVELARISAEWADAAIIAIHERGLTAPPAAGAAPPATNTSTTRDAYSVPRPGGSK